MRAKPFLPLPLLLLLGVGALLSCDDKTTSTTAASATTTPTTPATASATASAAASASVTASASAAPKPPPESIICQHVLVAYKGAKNAPANVTRTKAEAKARATEVHDKAVAGEDFTKLAQDYSDDQGSRERLGSVGKFKRDGMVKPFSDAAFALQVDGISDVVETPFGFHVIKRTQ